MKKESFLYVVIFTFIVAFLFVFIISLVDNATADRVTKNRELVTAQAFLAAMGIREENGEKTLLRFQRLFGEGEGEGINQTMVEDKPVLVKRFSGQGLWGTITGVLAVDVEVSRMIGLDIISHAETPGLGARIEEPWFKNQFRGEKIPATGIRIGKGEGTGDTDPDNGLVDGVTGASLTSQSLQNIINHEFELLREGAHK